ncbi:ankyrin repeat domain-containing protein [Kitasatospora purpeofusca]|uniref:ankyrin repeat domain-containing protein n=1 Tax=Kitasatospora purpeofusca TaxID=67352 RepID=UPI0039A75679
MPHRTPGGARPAGGRRAPGRLGAGPGSGGKSAGLVNTRRVAGSRGWTPLHQAAWHNAPTEVVERLLAAGARRPGGCGAGCRTFGEAPSPATRSGS